MESTEPLQDEQTNPNYPKHTKHTSKSPAKQVQNTKKNSQNTPETPNQNNQNTKNKNTQNKTNKTLQQKDAPRWPASVGRFPQRLDAHYGISNGFPAWRAKLAPDFSRKLAEFLWKNQWEKGKMGKSVGKPMGKRKHGRNMEK